MTTPPEIELQRYELLAPLGSGGQGRTFRALDRQSSQQVAIKLIQLGGEGWKPFDLFERECRVLRSLEHPGIPRFLDSFARETEGKYFLVMELVEGRTLRQLLEEGRLLDEGQLWNVLHQALEILSYMHGRRPPVIHRDIKPANLIQRPDGRLALVDFGGVRVALRPEGGSTVIGTFGYMAPEQLHGEATPATDIYGVAATLAALATGMEADRLPRRGLRIALDQVLPASALRDLLLRMLEPDPDDRLASVAEVRRQAEAFAVSKKRSGDRSEAAAEASEAGTAESEDLEPGPLQDLPAPLRLVLRVFGVFGYTGLVLLDAIVLPLLFSMLGATWSGQPDKLTRLQERRARWRRALRSGRKTMKALARGRDPYRPDLPKLPPGAGPRRQLPAGRGAARGGRGRGRGRRGAGRDHGR